MATICKNDFFITPQKDRATRSTLAIVTCLQVPQSTHMHSAFLSGCVCSCLALLLFKD